MERLIRVISSVPAAWILATALAMVVGVGWLDHLTGPYVSLALIYLAPIALVSWRFGRPSGLAVAGISAMVGLMSDLASAQASLTPFWNATMRLGVFCLVVAALDGLRRSHEAERLMARTDALTAVANARYFAEEAQRQIAGARRYGQPLTLAYLDLDNFKAVNDTFGHSTGDALLRRVGQTLSQSIRPTDLVARIGGDEFVLLLPHTDAEGSVRAMARLQLALVQEMTSQGWAVTASIGVAELGPDIQTVDQFVGAADLAMYEAKRAGKDPIDSGDDATREGEPERLDPELAPALGTPGALSIHPSEGRRGP